MKMTRTLRTALAASAAALFLVALVVLLVRNVPGGGHNPASVAEAYVAIEPLGPRAPGVTATPDGVAARYILEYLTAYTRLNPAELAEQLASLATQDRTALTASVSPYDGEPRDTRADVGAIQRIDGSGDQVAVELTVEDQTVDRRSKVVDANVDVYRVTVVRQADGTWRVDDLSIY